MGPILSRFSKNKKLLITVSVILVLVFSLVLLNAAANQATTKSTTDTSVFSTPTPTPAATPDNTATGNYFAVPELGVKFDKSSDLLSDLVYTVKSVNGHQAAYFSSARLKSAGGARCGEANGPLGILALEPTTNDIDQLTVIGSNYLNFTIPAAPCSTTTSVMRTSLEQAQALRNTLQKVIVVQ